jgi:hypothetical protein
VALADAPIFGAVDITFAFVVLPLLPLVFAAVLTMTPGGSASRSFRNGFLVSGAILIGLGLIRGLKDGGYGSADIAVKAGAGLILAALVCAVARHQTSVSSAIRAAQNHDAAASEGR